MAHAEQATRFSSLLQPIRDLSKIWNIDIADELQRYVGELAQVGVEGMASDGIPQYNFAEGALLIQGSATIYSRKVEILYDLVCQALELLHSDKASMATTRKGKCGASGFWGPLPETEELLTIDHLIKEGRGLQLDANAPDQRTSMQRRVPLFLMPRNKENRRSSQDEFMISRCTVHYTGAYLLQESDSRLLDDLAAQDGSLRQNGLDAPLVPPPPSNVYELDQELQALQERLRRDNTAHEQQLVATPGGATGATPARMNVVPTPVKTPINAMSEQLARTMAPAGEFWSLQDEHMSIEKSELPLEVGKSAARRALTKKLLSTAESLPDVNRECLSGEELWGEEAATGVAAMAMVGDPVEQLFLAVGGHLRGSSRYETQRARFSPAWLEFEDLFSAAKSKWHQLRVATGGQAPRAAPEEDEALTPRKKRNSADASDDELEKVKLVTPVRTPGDVLMGTPGRTPKNVDEEHRRGVDKLEGMISDAQKQIQDAQQRYEATIRQHLNQITADSADGDNQKFPNLYATVRQWTEQLEPVLKEFETRPEFHIMEYSTDMLDGMVADELALGEGVPFKALVAGCPRYEVCRRFLTALFLTNQGNTDILFDSEHERINSFKVKVMKAEKQWITLEAEQAPLKDQEIAKGRRRAKATLAVADEQAAPRKRARTSNAGA